MHFSVDFSLAQSFLPLLKAGTAMTSDRKTISKELKIDGIGGSCENSHDEITSTDHGLTPLSHCVWVCSMQVPVWTCIVYVCVHM